jgi:hypothetical protein
LKIINEKINGIIDKIPFLVKLPSNIGFDFRMNSKPAYTQEFINVALRTEFFDWENRKPSRYQPQQLPNVVHEDKMIHTMISDFPGLTAGDIIQQKKLLNVWITDDLIPPGIPIRLYTNSFKDIFPNFDATFPDSEVKIHISGAANPSVLFRKNGVIVQIPMELKWFAVDPENGKLLDAFTLNGGVGIRTVFGLKEMNVTSKIEEIMFDFKVKETNIGEVHWNNIQQLADFFIERSLKNYLNDFFATSGIPLPKIPGFNIPSSFFRYEQGFAGIAIDGEYIFTMNSESENVKKERYCLDCRQSVKLIKNNLEKSITEIQSLSGRICDKYKAEVWVHQVCIKTVGYKLKQKMKFSKSKLSPVVICDKIKACNPK